MSKITQLKLFRIFEKKDRFSRNEKRDVPLAPIESKTVECLGCGGELKMFYGQIVFWHSECRKKGRERMRRSLLN